MTCSDLDLRHLGKEILYDSQHWCQKTVPWHAVVVFVFERFGGHQSPLHTCRQIEWAPVLTAAAPYDKGNSVWCLLLLCSPPWPVLCCQDASQPAYPASPSRHLPQAAWICCLPDNCKWDLAWLFWGPWHDQ
jgi:hypothetical protein